MPLTGIAAATSSIAVIAALLLVGFGIRFAVTGSYRRNGLLMVIAGLVIFANVLIWTV
jgi:hypothetical protein